MSVIPAPPVNTDVSPVMPNPQRHLVGAAGIHLKLRTILSGPSVQTFTLRDGGTAHVISAEHMPRDVAAATTLAKAVLDHRYYEVVHHALRDQFALHFLVLRRADGRWGGLQPFFMLRQNILAGVRGTVARLAERVRRWHPNFLTLHTLMVGNPAGPAALGMSTDCFEGPSARWFVSAMAEGLLAYGRRHGASVVVLKDFPQHTREAVGGLAEPRSGNGFAHMASLPMTALPLSSYRSFDDYMQRALSKVTRKGLRRKFRDAAGADLQMSVCDDVSDCIDQVYALYLQVFERARLKFEKLTPRYFLELGRRMPDRARFFLWRLGGKQGRLVAFSTTLVGHEGPAGDKALYDLYLGMEYPLALDLHLYFVTMRDILEWAMAQGVATYYSTPLNYDAKLHFRHRLVPQDLYLRHTSRLLNTPFKAAMRFAQPTRYDRILDEFPNARQMKEFS